jgi:hypothetical protein
MKNLPTYGTKRINSVYNQGIEDIGKVPLENNLISW